MKKNFYVFSIFILLFLITGCGGKSENKIVCSLAKDGSFGSIEINNILTFDKNELQTVNVTMNMNFNSEYSESVGNVDSVITILEEQYKRYEDDYGIIFNIERINNTVRISLNADKKKSEKIFDYVYNSQSKDKIVSELESKGYYCKN